MKIVASRAWTLLGLLGLTACESDPVVVCDPCFTSAVLYGEIRDSQGGPAAQVPFDLVAYDVDSCTGNLKLIARYRTDDLGEFGGLASSLAGPFMARCFAVTIDPDSTSEWPTQELQVRDSVWFLAEFRGDPRDSLRLELTVWGPLASDVYPYMDRHSTMLRLVPGGNSMRDEVGFARREVALTIDLFEGGILKGDLLGG